MNFDDYIQQLLGNTNPQGNMFTGLSSMPPSANNIPSVNNNDPFSVQNAIDARNASNVVAAPAPPPQEAMPTSSGMLNTGNVGGGGGGDSSYDFGTPSNRNSIGIGRATDAINFRALLAGGLGFLTGGMPNALLKAARSRYEGGAEFLERVNANDDPLRAWAVEQGYAPAPVVNMDTPYGGADSATQPAVTSPVDMAYSPTTPIAPLSPVAGDGMFTPDNPAVASPVDMAFSPTTPIAPLAPVSGGGLFAPTGPMPVDPGIQAAINAQAAARVQASQAEAQAQAEMQARAAAQTQAEAQARAASQARAAAAQAQAEIQARAVARMLDNSGGGGSYGGRDSSNAGAGGSGSVGSGGGNAAGGYSSGGW
jgi:hypothetical protein